MKRLRALLVTVFGLGHMRPASGTWGSTPPPAMVLLLLVLVARDGLTTADLWIVNGALIVLGLIFAIACVSGGPEAEARYGRKDPGQVVADEVAGQCITMLALPWRAMDGRDGFVWNVILAGSAFIAFRLFDIIKPPPARGLERLPAGWGILVDDLFAGVYALAAMQVVFRLVL